MKKYMFVEISCVIFVVLFIFFSTNNETKSSKSAEEISAELIDVFNDDALVERSAEHIKKAFNIDLSDFSSYSYYSTDDVMNVGEYFVGVLAEGANEDFNDLFENYTSEKFVLYNGYAPMQAAYLDNYVFVVSKGVVLFCVGENAELLLDAFYSTV